MAFISTAMTIFAVTSRLVALATATPVPSFQAGGIAIPLTRHSSFLRHSNGSIDLDAITSHGISVREKILSGLDNYEMNTGTMHPLAVKRSESGLGKHERGSLPLASHQNGIWVGQISIGTPPQTLTVQITTGSADMWVLGIDCVGITPDHRLWDPISSETIEYTGKDQSFELSYGDGTVIRGDRYIDNVTIAGYTADTQTFGAATSYASRIQNNGYPEGSLGLAFPSISKFGADPLLNSLIGQGSLINPRFSLKLTSSGAEMYVGGANIMMYTGHIYWTHVTVPGFWQVSMDDIRLNGQTRLLNIPAILDTGSNLIFGDQERVELLYETAGGIHKPNEGIYYYTLPCHSFPTVSISFNRKRWYIPPEVLNIGQVTDDPTRCYGAIVGHEQSDAYWVLGTPFLQTVYTVFDTNVPKVGFAYLS